LRVLIAKAGTVIRAAIGLGFVRLPIAVHSPDVFGKLPCLSKADHPPRNAPTQECGSFVLQDHPEIVANALGGAGIGRWMKAIITGMELVVGSATIDSGVRDTLKFLSRQSI
jgi:hypothetical protein